MYGWIETGGFFNFTQSNDLVIRSSSANQFIAIGNSASSNGTAAMYISCNQVGVSCTPNNAYSLSVKGDSLFFNSSVVVRAPTSQIDINGSNLNFRNNTPSMSNTSIYIDVDDSRMNVDTIVTRSVFSSIKNLENVVILNTSNVSFPNPLQGIDELASACSSTASNMQTGTNSLADNIHGWDISIHFQYKDHFTDGTIFTINRVTFIVWFVTFVGMDSVKLRISSYSKHMPYQLPFAVNDIVNIEIIDHWGPENIPVKDELMYYKMYSCGHEFIDFVYGPNSTDKLEEIVFRTTLKFQNPKSTFLENLLVGSLFVFGETPAVANRPIMMPSMVPLRLISIQTNFPVNDIDQTTYTMEFESIDGSTKLSGNNTNLNSIFTILPGQLKTIYMLPLTHIIPPAYEELDGIVGYSIDTITGKLVYQITNANLSQVTNTYAENINHFSHGLAYIRMGNRPIKRINRYYTYLNGGAIVDAFGGVDDEVFNVCRQSIKYALRGAPLKISEIQKLSDSVYVVEFYNTYDLTKIELYKGCFMYWIDTNNPDSFILKILDAYYQEDCDKYVFCISDALSDNKLTQITNFLSTERIIYISPMRFTHHTRIGNSRYNLYAPTSLSIGTHKLSELLTVNGTGSVVKNFSIYNGHDRTVNINRFKMTYSQDYVLNMNDKLAIGLNFAKMSAPFEVSSIVTAMDFVKYSDERLKENILPTSEFNDLMRLMQIPVKTYQFKSNKRASKGVIAQDIEHIFPEAIANKQEVIPSISYIGVMDYKNERIRIHSFEEKYLLQPGCKLRLQPIQYNGSNCFVDIDIITYIKSNEPIFMNEDVIYVYIDLLCDVDNLLYNCEFIRVIGIIDNVKIVNYEVLYMSAINAIKCLKHQVDALQRRIEDGI